MTPRQIAETHFKAALADGAAAKIDADSIARYMLGLVLDTYLETRTPDDVKAELMAATEHLEPDDEFTFMRP